MRKILSMLLCLVLMLSCASSLSEGMYQAVIDDKAGLLSAEEAEKVAAAMEPIKEFGHAGFLTYDGYDSTDVLRKARKWGDIRFGEAKPYTVFIIDMATRRVGIYSSRSLYRLLSTSRAHSITDNVYSYASRGEYGACAEEAFHEMAQVLRGEKIAEPMKVTSNILLALICAMLLTYLGASAWMKQDQNRRLPPVVRNSLLGAAATIVTAHTVYRVEHNSSSSGSGGGSSGGGGGGGGGGGSHGF